MSWRSEAAMFTRFVTGLGAFLSTPLAAGEGSRQLAANLGRREEHFLSLLRTGVFDNPSSPYLVLMRNAGVEFADLQKSVRERGIEETLQVLWHEGVRLSLDEFKGCCAIVRDGLEITPDPLDFSNPLKPGDYMAKSGGSRGSRARLAVDFDILALEAGHLQELHEAHGLSERPAAIWWPVPPGSAGFKNALRLARLGNPPVRWFSQVPLRWNRAGFKAAAFTHFALFRSRWSGQALPRPEHVPLNRAERVAKWLSEQVAGGMPGVLVCPVGAALRVCRAAAEQGMNITGSQFRLTGEPLTPARTRIIQDAGCQALCTYSMTECGLMGLACANGAEPDSVHLLEDKIAVLDRPDDDTTRQRLWLSTVHPSSPRIMINVESGDSAVAETGSCGCKLEKSGLGRRYGAFRSYEKLTSEGMHILASDLLELLDVILPAKFGGQATDYQFVEDYPQGLPRISLYINPQLGELDENALLSTVSTFLQGRQSPQALMGEILWQGNTFRVVRKAPLATAASKIQPLHVVPRGQAVL